jgi:hypothetical protein
MRVDAAEYPTEIVRYLLARKVLHPVLPIRCPRCSAEVPLRPEDLRSDHHCDLCGADTPLGLALGYKMRNDWVYRLAAEISPERLSETLPVMAVLSVMCSQSKLDAYPFVLGMEVESPSSKFEVDILIVLESSSRPLVVVGEVKSLRDPISAEEIQHLIALQKLLRGKNVDCYILAATLQPTLTRETVAALRSACEASPESLGQRILPVFPIVLTRKNLSVPEMHEDHPTTWHEVGTGLSTLAVESCRRNIGLVDVELENRDDGYGWSIHWS